MLLHTLMFAHQCISPTVSGETHCCKLDIFFLSFFFYVSKSDVLQHGWSKHICDPALSLCASVCGSPYPMFHSNDVVHIVLSLWASKNVSLNKSNDCTSCCLAGQKELNSNFYCLRHTIPIKDCARATVGDG